MARRIAFFGEAVTRAHVVRPFLLAATLNKRDFDIHFATADSYGLPLQQAGFTTWQLHSRTSEEFLRILQNGGILFDEAILERYIENDLELLRKINPEVVVGDFRISLAISARILGIPYLAVTNAYWSDYAVRPQMPVLSIPLFIKLGATAKRGLRRRLGLGIYNFLLPRLLNRQITDINTVRNRYGQRSFSNYFQAFTDGDLVLYCDCPALIPVRNLPETHRFIGAVSWAPDAGIPDDWRQSSRKQKIYLSLGSSGDDRVLPSIFEALSRMSVHVLMSTGEKSAPNNLPDNFKWQEFVDGALAAEFSDLVICNGGSPTSYQALSRGTPVIGIVSNMDQLLSMMYVGQNGSGITVRADECSPHFVTEAVLKALTIPSYKRAARQLGAEFENFNVATIFPQLVSEVLDGLIPERTAVNL